MPDRSRKDGRMSSRHYIMSTGHYSPHAFTKPVAHPDLPADRTDTTTRTRHSDDPARH